MCSPTIALTAISAGSSLIQYQQGKQQQKAEEARQKRQNALAKKNAKHIAQFTRDEQFRT